MAFVLKPGCRKNQRKLHEGDEPVKSLESEGNKYITEQVKKQTDTRITLSEALEQTKEFVQGLGYVTLKDGGERKLDQFQKLLRSISSQENSTSGSEETTSNKVGNYGRLDREAVLSVKPRSLETRLLAFALGQPREAPPDPLLQSLHHQIIAHPPSLANIITKKRKRLTSTLNPPVEKRSIKDASSGTSLWDMREVKQVKVFSCQPAAPTRPLEKEEPPAAPPPGHSPFTFVRDCSLDSVVLGGLTDQEIRLLPHFSNYTRGEPSTGLYVKNIKRSMKEDKFAAVIAAGLRKLGISMVGITYTLQPHQAFIHFKSIEAATKMLECLNGTDINGKKMVIQFSRSPKCK